MWLHWGRGWAACGGRDPCAMGGAGGVGVVSGLRKPSLQVLPGVGGDAAEKAAPATVPAGKLAELLLMEGNGGTVA